MYGEPILKRAFALISPNVRDPHGAWARPTDQQAVDNLILENLAKLQRYQESAKEDELCDTFVIRGPFDRNRFTMTHMVASAIVDLFDRDAAAAAKRRWKTLVIFDCVVNDSLCRVLEAAKTTGLFSSWNINLGPEHHNLGGSLIVLDQYCRNNPHLKDLTFHELTPAVLRSLSGVLRDPSCRIRRLDLGTSTASVCSLTIDALERSLSLEIIRLGQRLDPEQGHRILKLLDSCPQLREIDLSRGNIKEPFWGRYLSDPSPIHVRQRLYRIDLSLTILGLHAPDYHGEDMISRYDHAVQDLLLAFPALGDLGGSPLMRPAVFSLRATQLLAFNYAGRARLDTSVIPPVLWKFVLERVQPATRRGMLFLHENVVGDQHRVLLQSCQASVLFSLLRSNPTIVADAA